jgi:integrase
MERKKRAQPRAPYWRMPGFGQDYDPFARGRENHFGGYQMSLNLFRRNGVWHYRGTIGPPERRARVRGTLRTKDKATAERQAAQYEDLYWKGHFDGPGSILTFRDAAKKYRAAGKSALFLRPLEKYLGRRLVKDIKPSTIQQMAIDLYGHCSGATQNRLGITPAQAVINFMAAAEQCSPIRVERFKENPKVKEPATLEWVQKFRTAASPELGTYALFMFLTGCRPSEALAIDPDKDMNLKAGTCIIKNTKAGGQRKAHLPAILVTALANMPIEPGRPLFWYRHYNDVTWPWNQAIKRAGIQHLTPHCCRHGCVTQLLRRKIDVVTVGWLVDMTPEMVLETYGHALKDATLTDRLTDVDLTVAMLEVVGKKHA